MRWWLVCGFWLLAGGSVFGNESPQRFLQATQWIAQITRDVSDHGSSVQDGCNWSWDLTTAISVQVRMTKIPGGEAVAAWRGVETQTYTGMGHENFSSICPDGGNIIAQGQPGTSKPAPNLGLSMDLAAGKYTISFGAFLFPWDGTIAFGPNVIPQADSIGFWSGDTSGNIERALPTNGMALEGQDTYPLKKPPLVHTSMGTTTPYIYGLGNGDVRIRWNIRPEIEVLELAVEIENYQDWLPEGNFDDASKAGNLLDVKATVRGTNGAPTQAKATWIRFELVDVSREPGVCLNAPMKSFAKTDPDYKFEQDQNPAPMFWMNANRVETIPGQHTTASAVVSSFDFGGWCKLKVTAEVQGQVLVGYLTTDMVKDSPEIRLPRRQVNSHIADKWLEDEGAVGLADDGDVENVPAGDGHAGDGYSLYEEYRGFKQNGAILRSKAKKKDLMILNTIGGPGVAAVRLFQSMTQIEVHDEFQVSEFSSAPLSANDNWLNFNHGSHHVVDQHGLRIVQSEADEGYAAANNREGISGNSTPGSKSEISVPPQLTLDAVTPMADGGRTAMYAAASYAHEIGHGCSIYHHGESDPGTVSWLPVANASGGFDFFEDGASIIPRLENGGLFTPPALGTNVTYVAEQHGQHSGNGFCNMRYDVARWYIFPSGSATRFRGGNEVVGQLLCSNGTGTGVNQAGRQPRPRFGDAAPGRGNCLGQLCVNDKYVSDALHRR